MFDRRIARALVALSIAAAPAYAQSLGEVARQEEARRATTQKAAIVLSNSDLHPGEIAQPAANSPTESCYMSISKGRCVSAEEMVSNSVAGRLTKENAPFEPTWRQDAESIRSQIQDTAVGARSKRSLRMKDVRPATGRVPSWRSKGRARHLPDSSGSGRSSRGTRPSRKSRAPGLSRFRCYLRARRSNSAIRFPQTLSRTIR
jgi:hypothetical protein